MRYRTLSCQNCNSQFISKGGRTKFCLVCRPKMAVKRGEMWVKQNKERYRAMQKDWERRNPDKLKEKWRRQEAKPERKAQRKRYAFEHRELFRERGKKYYANNRTRCIAKSLKYQRTHPEKIKEIDSRFRRNYLKRNQEQHRRALLRTQAYRLRPIEKDDYCSTCGTLYNLEHHHYNYDSWNQFIILCQTCHKNITKNPFKKA